MKMLRVLLVDDDPEFLRRFDLLGEGLFETRTARSAAEAFESLERSQPDAILLDVDLGAGPNGLEMLARLRREHPELPVVMVSGDESPETVVAAMRGGAVDYISKSPNLQLLRVKLERALDDDAWRIHARSLQAAAGELVGSSAAMRTLRQRIQQVAPLRMRVLVSGESGSGKELVARAIHEAGPRRRERLVALSGATGSDELFDSELFGHEKGAFTGAAQRRIGKYELAHGGTLFLDEIGRMPRARQAKLLRVVETGRFERLGGGDEIACDVRLVTATNENLEQKAKAGEFLRDLLFRIDEFRLVVPPLRDRLADLNELVPVLLGRFARAEGLPLPSLADGALDPLFEYGWPGNVRELDTMLKRAVIQAGSGPLTADHLRRCLPAPDHGDGSASGAGQGIEAFLGGDFADARDRLVAAFERRYIQRSLDECHGNISRAAERLGMSRSTLHRKLHELGIDAGP
ncbi:MAG: sigma-54-dependent Fis family transcriptional regulator [Acidobacteria bacterium]|nr:sigma-54-dependent Fis family transcriptional regulator [Acidobacteriota bacterium]